MPRVPSSVAVAALVLLSTVVRAWAGLRVPSPWIAADEMIYAELGRSLWETGHLDVLGHDAPFYSLVHPALIGLPLALFDTAAGYDVARVLQAFAMSLTAVPVFLWGRTLMSERWALVAAGLTLTIPGLAYSGLLMTETVFYAAMTLAAWAAAHALARPSRWAHALLVGAFALCVLTRLQALVLVPVFALALALLALLERRLDRRSLAPLAALAVLALGWLTVAGFGGYGAAGRADYDFGDAIRFTVYHVGDALLLTGFAPACALAVLVFRLDASRDVRAYLAVAIAMSVGIVAEVGVFASRYVGRLAERDLLPLAPLLFLGLCLWLERGAPRPRILAPVIVLVAAALVVVLPYGRLVHKAALTDAFMLVPVWELGSYETVIGVATVAVALLVVFAPRVLPLALAALFVAVSISATRFVEREAETLRASFFADDPAWVDASVDGDVAYFYDGEPHWNAVWAHVFWNRRIRDVIDLFDARVPGPLAQRRATPDRFGRIGDTQKYIVGSTAFTFFGEPVAQIEQHGLVHKGLVLWRVDPPLRIATILTGVQGSGDIYGPAQLVAFDCTTGTLDLTLVAKGAPLTVGLARGGFHLRTLSLAPEEVWTASIPAVPSDSVCVFDVVPSGLVGSTRFAFTRG